MGRPKKVVTEQVEGPAPSFNLQNFVKNMAKDKPEAEIQLLGESDGVSSSFTVPWWIPTGLLGLDYVLGGGIPGGRIIEIFSNNPSEGKTATCALLAAAAQKAGGLVLLIDTESGTLIERLNTLGVDINQLIISQPDSLEQVFDVIHTFIEAARTDGFSGPILIVFDSVAATPTKSQLEATYEQNLYAPAARVLSSGLRKLMPILRDTNSTLVCANQVREIIGGVAFGETKQTTGGMGLRFFCHIRLALSRLSNLKNDKNEVEGIEVKINAKKNKLTRPFKSTVVKLMFKNGFDFIDNEFNFALEKAEIVENGKGYYSFKDNMEKKFRASAYPEYRTVEFTEKLKTLVKL